jgi:H/ACA ribonucleoprotein complex subunit 3
VRSRILRCVSCQKYTMKGSCPVCGSLTENTFPPRYSPEDRYGKYRRLYYKEVEDKKE